MEQRPREKGSDDRDCQEEVLDLRHLIWKKWLNLYQCEKKKNQYTIEFRGERGKFFYIVKSEWCDLCTSNFPISFFPPSLLPFFLPSQQIFTERLYAKLCAMFDRIQHNRELVFFFFFFLIGLCNGLNIFAPSPNPYVEI